jgi:hypothetical protein
MTAIRARACGFAAIASGCAALAVTAFGPGSAALAGAAGTRTAATPTSASLGAVSVVPGTSQAWAVGSHGNGIIGGSWVLRLRAGKWSVVAAAKTAAGVFSGVAAASDRDIWLTGFVQGRTSAATPLLEHSTGGSFASVRLPVSGDGELVGISASSKNNAWAVGFLGNPEVANPRLTPLALHWNGRSWKKVPVLGGRVGYSVSAVSTSGAANAWAIAGNAAGTTALLHFNGRRWSVSSYKAPSGVILSSIATSSAGDAWVVGATSNDVGMFTYSAHWNGRRWYGVSTPQSHDFSQLYGVAVAGKGALAVGQELVDPATFRLDPLIVHFTGKTWHQQKAPNPAGQPSDGQSTLAAVSAASSSFAVAVGYYYLDGGSCGPLGAEAAVYNGRTWKPAKLPSAGSSGTGVRPACS